MSDSSLCHYCKKKTRIVKDKFGSSYQCDWHGAVRVQHIYSVDYATNQTLIDITLVVMHKEEAYHATFFYNYDSPYKFRINKANRHPKTHHTILTLDFHPEITPENIASKLPTMILFS